jgi:hypothetical protein
MSEPAGRKAWWVAGGILLAVVLGAAGWFFVHRVPADELTKLAVRTGVRELREPLRPHTNGARVLLFALDGVGDDELRARVGDATEEPWRGLLGARQSRHRFATAYWGPAMLSILPSTTVAAWTTVYTGQPPGRTGVPGNEWFAREEGPHGRFYAPAPVSVSGVGDALRTYSEGLVGASVQVPTLFERAGVRSHVSMAQVFRGADVFTSPEPGSIADLLGELAKGVVTDDDVEREAFSELDEESAEEVLQGFQKHGIPRLQVIYFSGVDLFAHVAQKPLEQERSYLRDIIEPLVQRILEAYARAGVLEDTYVLFVADHGHTPVLEDDRHALSVDEDDEPTAVLVQQGFRVRPPKLEIDDDEQDFQAVVAYQGAIAYVYLADRSGCAPRGAVCDWKRAPRLEEDVLPVARAFFRASAEGEGVAQLRDSLDLVLARPPRGAGESPLPFEVFDGTRLVPVREWLSAHPRPDLLQLAERLEALGTGPLGNHAGDVLLLARSGLERPIEERFYFAANQRSWHGSPSAQDSRVPLLVARPGQPGAEIEADVGAVIGDTPSQLDVTPLILHLLRQE